MTEVFFQTKACLMKIVFSSRKGLSCAYYNFNAGNRKKQFKCENESSKSKQIVTKPKQKQRCICHVKADPDCGIFMGQI